MTLRKNLLAGMIALTVFSLASFIADGWLQSEVFSQESVTVGSKEDAKHEYGVDLAEFEKLADLDAIVAVVAHDESVALDLSSLASKSDAGVPFIDIKSSDDCEELEKSGFSVWRL